jgi:SAM-dependent methyltransferase
MVICPICATPLLKPRHCCPQCGFEPQARNGFVAWGPQLADSNDGFHREDFAALAPVEAQHFWFRARNDLILWALGRYAPGFQSLLEIGCGTGFVLTGIARLFPKVRLVGTEVFVEGLAFAGARVPAAELMQMDARALPYVDEFDVVAAFDVIEHIDEDELVLRNLYRATKPAGCCIVSVPQHMWLWSPVDEEACHKRRYNARELEAKAVRAGFRIVRSTSFATILLPVMLLSRLMDRKKGKTGGTESLRMNPAVNRVLESLLRLEHVAIQAGWSLPVGGSRLMVLRKP